ncbi:Threonine aldolase [Apophysomyces ossiformis]|uniref:Threonine aldolase n=1 Tax=Apophysomyces ossiformis TaxID=679940 RepID=A0A8H7BHS1_9FUNG|nr:Threonine aldolase [Apophysomyces ossiformis]
MAKNGMLRFRLYRRPFHTAVTPQLYIQNKQQHVDPKLKLYDFRSDTVTEPTNEMFEVMKAASRGDSVFEEDQSVKELEGYVAEKCGHEAGLFCASGTMTNQLGLLGHLTQPPQSVLCDSRSHVYLWEAGGIAFHSRASVTPVIARNGVHITADEVERNLVGLDIHTAPTGVISLENTLNGLIFPIEEIRKISELGRSHDLAMHLDGARLWNASQESDVPLSEYGKYFDSMSLCLSKGVGAPIGSVLVGNAKFISRARHLRKLFGGGWRQAGPIAAAAQYCIDTIVPTMKSTHMLAKRMADQLLTLGVQLQMPVQTNMIHIDTTGIGLDIQKHLQPALLRHNIKIGGEATKSRIVLHHQIDKYAVDTFVQVVRDLIHTRNSKSAV